MYLSGFRIHLCPKLKYRASVAVPTCSFILLHNEGRLLGRTRGTRSRPRPRRWRPSSTPSCRPRSSRRTASCGASRSAVYIYPMSTQYLHNICTISTPYLYMVWRLQVCCTDSFRKDVEGLKQQLDSLLCSRQARDTGICQVSTDDLCPHWGRVEYLQSINRVSTHYLHRCGGSCTRSAWTSWSGRRPSRAWREGCCCWGWGTSPGSRCTPTWSPSTATMERSN